MTSWRRASWTLRWLARTWPRGKDGRDPVTWVWKAFRERTTPAGKTLCGIWLALLPIAVLTGGRFGGGAFALVSSALAAGWLWTLRSPRMSASAILPDLMREGGTVSVQVSLRVREGEIPVGAGAWIFRTSDGLEAVGDGAVALVRSGHGTVDVPLRALRRGPQSVEGPTVLRQEPLGLFRSRSLKSAPAKVLVLPRSCRIVSLDGLLPGPGATEFAAALQAASGQEDFVGIRPWREGDDIRTLHHRTWARTGKPAVRETEREVGGGVVLAFSSAGGTWDRRSLLDPAISLAAGLAKLLSGRGALSGFLLDDAWVPLPRRDPVLAVESALARLPGPIGWRRLRQPDRRRNEVPAGDPVLSIGFARQFPTLPPKRAARAAWVDWGHGALPVGVLRVDPERILSGDVRL